MSHERRPTRLLMASESTCSAAKRDFQTALLNQVQAAFPLPKSSLHSYGSPIDSEHDDYPANQVLYYDGIGNQYD